MRILAWFLVGIMCAYEATDLFPSTQGFPKILSSFIIKPIRFMEGSVFVLASFLIFSYSIRFCVVALINRNDLTRQRLVMYGMINVVILLAGWSFLFYRSLWVGVFIALFTFIHLGLSYDKLQKADHQER